MSEQRVTYGLAAIIEEGCRYDSDAREDMHDDLEEDHLRLNYDGDLVYLEAFDGDPWDAEVIWGVNEFGSKEKFCELCHKHGIRIEPETIDVFYANWYDGCDSPMSVLTAEEFRSR